MLRGQRLGIGWTKSDAEINRIIAEGGIESLNAVLESEALLALVSQGAQNNEKVSLLLEI